MNMNKKIESVLVVDDDPVQTRLLESRLKENGYKITVTTEAAEGLQIAMDQKPDLIVLDVMMPIINGYNFCKLLKTEKLDKRIAIILLTSRDDKEDVEIGLEMGADAYLTKPVNIEELLKTIKVVETMDKN